ncbi:ATP-binding cassette domain-containing protein [Salinibacterium sp. SWN139]|uniref:ABC transporter ATP-binding protein n=1 Tax=Salinibacterium sp. SWN139 TaxID=2792055 RepID=UPI0018CCDEC2|nr:ATP-binding cassette domain-containing protein [Salinibacterium sp. SWN139]MBH0054382.1 ATP-binding cassette domain-containing protein [Salinibacterium sp. SWN139]
MLQLDNISKTFGTRPALDGVSFSVRDGRMTGFVGGNGAGKTTTMRILLGVLESDAGDIQLDGKPLDAEQRRHFGYMPEERGLYPKMKVREQLVYLARLHGYTQAAAGRNADSLLEELGLGERRDSTLESLSLGNQQRAQIAASLVHDPAVLVLDEPFSGLDPLAVDTVVEVLKQRAAGGAAVLFSSHQLEIVERLCDDLVIIAEGSIRAAGEREALRAQHSAPRYTIVTSGDLGWLRDEPGISVVEFDGGHATFDAEEASASQRVLRRAVAEGDVTSFAPQRASLAQIFREVI